MSHTYSNLLTHVVFSTHERAPTIGDAIREDLYAYIGGIVRELRGKALAVGGTSDHVHMLLKLPCELAIAECLRIVKANSSLWLHEKWPERKSFAWQVGYGAFSVSESGYGRVREYIRGQEAHHRGMSFREEFILLLRKQGIDFEERYLWR
jgi:putative transposase